MSIFISFASDDENYALEIGEKLKRKNIKFFIAPKSLKSGDLFKEKIREEILGCSELFLLVTSHSLQSEWVISEYGAAWALGKRIVPILLDCNLEMLPSKLADLQARDFKEIDKVIEEYEGRTKITGIRKKFKQVFQSIRTFFLNIFSDPILLTSLLFVASIILTMILNSMGYIEPEPKSPDINEATSYIYKFKFLAWAANFILIFAILCSIDLYSVKQKKFIATKDTIANFVYDQFKDGWIFIWASWLAVYAWYIIFSYLFKDQIAESFKLGVADFFHIFNSCAFFYCFLVLDMPSVKTIDEPFRNRKFKLIFSAVIFMALICYILALLSRSKLSLFNNYYLEDGVIVFSVFMSLSMIFLFGRLDSSLLEIPRFKMLLLYSYGLMQLLYAFIDKLEGNIKNNIIVVLVYFLAFALKILFWRLIANMIKDGKLMFYIKNIIKIKSY